MSSTPLEVVLKRDRVLVLGGLVIVSALAWGYLFQQAHSMHQMKMDGMNMSGMDMSGMDMGMSMAMPQTHSWATLDLLLIFTNVGGDDGSNDGSDGWADGSPLCYLQS